MNNIGIWEALSFLGALLLIEAGIVVWHFCIKKDGDNND